MFFPLQLNCGDYQQQDQSEFQTGELDCPYRRRSLQKGENPISRHNDGQ
jgi:hypothetical protein